MYRFPLQNRLSIFHYIIDFTAMHFMLYTTFFTNNNTDLGHHEDKMIWTIPSYSFQQHQKSLLTSLSDLVNYTEELLRDLKSLVLRDVPVQARSPAPFKPLIT